MIKKNTINKIISVCTVLVIMSAVLFTYRQYDSYKTTEQEYIDVKNVMTTELDMLIKAVLSENKHKAELYIGEFTNTIHQRLLKDYGNDLEGLEEDIMYPSLDSKLTTILDSVLTDVYINEDNNSNKPFASSMSLILWDKTLGFNIDKDNAISWHDFKELQYNINLAQEAIDNIQSMNNTKNDFIFWESIESNIPNHIIIEDMSIQELLNVYHVEGIQTLKSYELLIPLYITKDGDIFGTSDINSLGHKIDNYKIIIIQRINIYDALKPYMSDISYCEAQVQNLYDRAVLTSRRVVSLMVQSLIFIVFILIASAIIQNKIAKNK